MIYKITTEKVVYVEASSKAEAEFLYEVGCVFGEADAKVVEVVEDSSYAC